MFLFSSSEEKKVRQDAKTQMEICLRSFQEKSQDKYKKSMEFISRHIQNYNQEIIEIVVDNIKSTIKDDEQTPVRKYQAIRLLRDLMKIEIKNKNKALGKYVLKKIFKRLKVLAAHRASSNEEDRGKDIFKNVQKNQEKYSILFLNELLLAIQEWAKTWPGISEGLKKQFNEAYKQLLTEGVKFPKQVIKAPQPQGQRGQQTNRNSSQSPYSSIPKRQSSMGKTQQKSQIKSTISQKPAKKQPTAPTLSEGKLDSKKVKSYFKDIIPSIEEFMLIVDQLQNPDDPDSLAFVNDMIEQLRNVIASGDSFCTQLSGEEMKVDPLGKIILSALSYSDGASRDLKKLIKNPTQFDRFRSKYIKLGNQLLQNLKNSINPPKEQKPAAVQKLKVEKKVQTVVQQVTQVKKVQELGGKKLNVPRVSSQNQYNSSSGPGNNWVIKERSEYNSNSHRDENQVHEKFGSFGIGGIGEKARNQSSKQKERSGFAKQSETQRPSQQAVQSEIKVFEQKKPKTDKQIPSAQQVTQAQNQAGKQKNKETTFGSFKVSSENSKPQQSSQNVFENKNKRDEEVKDYFNDSDFKEQQKVQLEKQVKTPNLDESANFFGEFDQPNNLQQLPRANRNDRRKKTGGPTTKQINFSQENPFQNPFNSNIASDSNNFSAFNNEKPSMFGSQSQVPNQKSTSQVKPPIENKRKQSLNDPFQNSFQLNKSQRNSYDDKNPNFWEGQAAQSNQDDRSQRNRSELSNNERQESITKVQNPFENQEFSRKMSKSINPFDDDSKSEVSQKNKSSVLNFEMNRSFTKSESQNPFENPFQTTSNNLNRTNDQPTNPFEQTSKDEFKPPKNAQKFDSVSQQASFKKVDIKQAKIVKQANMDNPFQTMTQHKSIDEAKGVERMNESWKFSVKGNQQNEGFDFDQFQNVQRFQRDSRSRRDSVNTSSFPNPKVRTEPNEFVRQAVFQNKRVSIEKSVQNDKEKSIRFSQFGQANEETNRSKDFQRKEDSKKSVHFSDFDKFDENKPGSQNQFPGFSGFKETQTKKANDFDAFEVSKTSKNDFFKQTQKSYIHEKADDNKSRHSGFSGFNMNGDNRSENKDHSVNWDEFGNFEKGRQTDKVKFEEQYFDKVGSNMKKSKQSNRNDSQLKTDRNQSNNQTQKTFYNKDDLKLNFSQATSKYQSPQFNQKYESGAGNDQQQSKVIMSSLRQVNDESKQEQIRSSVHFEQFAPVQKKGYEWNPLGIRPERQLTKIFVCTDNELNQKKKELEYHKQIYKQEKQLIQKAKELYNQARKVYLQKVSKIDTILKQKESYKKILVSLQEANYNKESEIFSMNEKIKEVSSLKDKILEKEKIFFQKTKTNNREMEAKSLNYRPNHNKWEIFNRNIKMMRQKEMESDFRYTSINYSRTGGYTQSRF